MLILKRIIIFFLGLFVVLSFLLYLSLHKPKLEWDTQNPEIHGEAVIFMDDMSYINLSKEHRQYGFNAEEVSLNKIIVETGSQEYEEILSYGGDPERIKRGTVFIIKKSYKKKFNWLSSAFNGSAKYALLETTGREAIVSFYQFSSSTRPEFSEIKWRHGEVE